MLIRIKIFAALIVLFPTILSAQAFGVKMGTPVTELNVLKDTGDFFFTISPPRSVSGFETYAVYATPNAGVCMVKAIGEDFKRDGYGTNVRGRFQELNGLLDQKYGRGELLDFLRAGALWEDVDEWVMAVRQNERFYQAEWLVKDADGIDDIIMAIRALSSNTSYISLQYRFSNMEDCDAEAREQEAGGL